MSRHLYLALLTVAALGCGADSNCVEPDLTGAWTESERSTMTLSQTCAGTVSGRWTTLTAAGVVNAEWNVAGRVEGTRFLWIATCVDDRCTNMTRTLDGTDGSGTDILDDGNRLMGSFVVPGRAQGAVNFTRD